MVAVEIYAKENQGWRHTSVFAYNQFSGIYCARWLIYNIRYVI